MPRLKGVSFQLQSFLKSDFFKIDFHVMNGSLTPKPYRGTSPICKHPPPWDPPGTLRIGLRQGPRGVRFLVDEVPLYTIHESSIWNQQIPRLRGVSFQLVCLMMYDYG